MTRPVVQLHTIEQWVQVSPEIRSLIVQSLKVKDRLYRYLQNKKNRPPVPDEGTWVPCNKCDKKGWVLKTPRHAGLHPSQIINSCLLKIYWQMEGKEEREKHNNRLLLIFDLGHAVHGMFQNYGMDGAWGEQYVPEVRMTEGSHPLATELMIEGSADAECIMIVDDIPNAPIYEVGVVHEYKTMNSNNFAKLTRPKPEHKQQAMVYSAVLNRPVVVFLYLSKNDSNLADFPVEFDPVVWGGMEQKARVLVDHYQREQEPPATTGYGCEECGFAFSCEAYKAFQAQRTKRR